ncbi:MAG TPA: MarR family transcriptional regulator [Solirubrobacteraceae bacterium]|nr:MarR family transcriptional regulator [Solirubrobacteraceae bacterium]
MSSSSSPSPTDESLGKLLKRSEQTLLRAKSAAVKRVGLTLPQYVALAELAERPGITGAELARACLVSPQAMMVVLKAMEEQGLIERTQHPRHQTVLEIHPTSVGREALNSARKHAEPIEQRITKALSKDEVEMLRTLLRRCIEAVGDTASRPGVVETCDNPASRGQEGTVSRAPLARGR